MRGTHDSKSQFGINADKAINFLNTMPSRAAGTPESLAGQPQIGDHRMPFRARLVVSVALATASFLLAPPALANRVRKLR
jgi:hypothetical protein